MILCVTETIYNIPNYGKNRPLLAVHPNKKYLDELDCIHNVPKMMVIPWIGAEVNEWAKQNNAISYGSNVFTSKTKSNNDINNVF